LGYFYNVQSILVKGHSTAKALFPKRPLDEQAVFPKIPLESKAVLQRKVPRDKAVFSKKALKTFKKSFCNVCVRTYSTV
jgi:hypothetical protein